MSMIKTEDIDHSIAALRRRHTQGGDWCEYTGDRWPCDEARVADALIEAREEIERIKKAVEAGYLIG